MTTNRRRHPPVSRSNLFKKVNALTHSSGGMVSASNVPNIVYGAVLNA
jgi:hypothetical protein